MKYITKCWVPTLLFASLIALSNQGYGQEKLQLVLEPREESLSVVVHQPDCPLEFKEASVYRAIGGGGARHYKLRNRSNKAITEIDIATLGLGGGGDLHYFKAKDRSQWVMPDQLWPKPRPDVDKTVLVEEVPLTDEIRKKYKIGPPMKGIAIFMVVRVKFADGSIYSDETVYKELQAFNEDVIRPDR